MGKPGIGKHPRNGRGRRRIAVVTGTRAEYGLLRSTICAIQSDRRLELQLIVTGMHLLPEFGRTVRDIAADGFRIAAKVKMQRGDNSPTDQAEGLGRGVIGISRFLVEAGTDAVVVLGDRIEAMAGALAAVTTGRTLAHIHGGDIAPGDFDDALRDAISKLAHYHFPATQLSADRLARMGLPRDRIYVVGPPGFDDIDEFLKRDRQSSGHPKNVALIVQHPCGRSDHQERRTMEAIINSVRASGLNAHIVYPNTDRGHAGIVQAICSAQSRNGLHIEVTPSLPRTEYLRAVRQARVLIGNSSSGLLEAGRLGTPVVNVGDRQAGRERYGGLIVDADESRESIHRAIKQALSAPVQERPLESAKTHGVGRKIARILVTLPMPPYRISRRSGSAIISAS